MTSLAFEERQLGCLLFPAVEKTLSSHRGKVYASIVGDFCYAHLYELRRRCLTRKIKAIIDSQRVNERAPLGDKESLLAFMFTYRYPVIQYNGNELDMMFPCT